MRRFLLYICAVLWLASLASSQPSETTTLSYAQALRLSVQWKQSALAILESSNAAIADYRTALQQANEVRQSLETSLAEASSSLESSNATISALRSSSEEASRLILLLQTRLKEAERRAFWRGLRNLGIGILIGVALEAAVL